MALKSFVIGALSVAALVAAGVVLCRDVNSSSLFGGGFYAASPDAQQRLEVYGDSQKVQIFVGPKASERTVLEYRHNADAQFFRERGNKVIWTDDSTQATANYLDIINGVERDMRFTYRIDGSWSLDSVPVHASSGPVATRPVRFP